MKVRLPILYKTSIKNNWKNDVDMFPEVSVALAGSNEEIQTREIYALPEKFQ